LSVNAAAAGATTLNGGDAGVVAATTNTFLITGATAYGATGSAAAAAALAAAPVAQVGLSGANAYMVNNSGHGVMVTADHTTISGGTSSTALTLNDNGATFSNTLNNAPVQVHGVADGTAPYDAVNYRQLREVAQGVASTVAMANIPQVSEGQTGMVGAGVGTFNGETSLAIGASYRFAPQAVMKASIGLSTNGGPATAGVGAGWAW